MFFPFLVHPTRSLRGVVPARVLTAGLSGVVGLGLATQSLVADLRPKAEMTHSQHNYSGQHIFGTRARSDANLGCQRPISDANLGCQMYGSRMPIVNVGCQPRMPVYGFSDANQSCRMPIVRYSRFFQPRTFMRLSVRTSCSHTTAPRPFTVHNGPTGCGTK